MRFGRIGKLQRIDTNFAMTTGQRTREGSLTNSIYW